MGPFALSALLAAALADAPAAPASIPASAYAIIVADNQSVDPDVAPLSYADDDAAKYYELFRAVGAKVALFAVLDPDSQTRYPEAAAVAKVPYREAVLAAAWRFFDEMRREPEGAAVFYFVYAGHGNVGPNREGYLSLFDGPFRRSELFAKIIAPSPAALNHIILDACAAYYMVNKRGSRTEREPGMREALQSFLASEELASYPNTGVLFASASEAEAHEWSRWQAGLFSHELRSALLGGADANLDGFVTYAEATAAVEAANAGIDDPKARLRVHARPPPTRINAALIDLSALRPQATLHFGAAHAQHYYVEDARGVRVADLHSSGEQGVRLRLIGVAPFFVRGDATEAEVTQKREDVGADVDVDIDVDGLAFAPLATTKRGSIDSSFRRYLYSAAFGESFLLGLLSTQGPGFPDWNGWFGTSLEPELPVAAQENAPPPPTPASTPAPTLTPAVTTTTTATAAPTPPVTESVPSHMATLGSRRAAGVAPVQQAPRPSGYRALGLLGLGGAGVTAVAGIVMGVTAQDSHRRYEQASTRDAIASSKRTAQQQALVANILFGSAAGLAITGGAFLLFDAVTARGQSSGPAATARTAVSLGVAPTDGGVSATLAMPW